MNIVKLLLLDKQVRGVFRCFSWMVSGLSFIYKILYLNNPNITSIDINPISTWVCMYNLPTLNVAQVTSLK